MCPQPQGPILRCLISELFLCSSWILLALSYTAHVLFVIHFHYVFIIFKWFGCQVIPALNRICWPKSLSPHNKTQMSRSKCNYLLFLFPEIWYDGRWESWCVSFLAAGLREFSLAVIFYQLSAESADHILCVLFSVQVYPTSVRSTGVGIASAVARIGGILCPVVAVSLVHGCHQATAIILFELVIFFSGMAVCFFPFETSGRGLDNSNSSTGWNKWYTLRSTDLLIHPVPFFINCWL